MSPRGARRAGPSSRGSASWWIRARTARGCRPAAWPTDAGASCTRAGSTARRTASALRAGDRGASHPPSRASLLEACVEAGEDLAGGGLEDVVALFRSELEGLDVALRVVEVKARVRVFAAHRADHF